MSEFWAGVKLGFRTLFSNPVSYLTDPVGATTTQYKKDLVTLGYTDIEIAQRIEDYHNSGGVITDVGMAYGSVTKGIGNAIKSAGGLIAFLGKNLVAVIVAAVVVVVIFYILQLKKAVE